MVAGPCHLCIAADRYSYCICWRFSDCTIHLYSFLMKDNDKHLGTMLIFAVVLIILYLVYRNDYFLYGALLAGAIGVLIPALSRLIHNLWMKLAELMGFV